MAEAKQGSGGGPTMTATNTAGAGNMSTLPAEAKDAKDPKGIERSANSSDLLKRFLRGWYVSFLVWLPIALFSQPIIGLIKYAHDGSSRFWHEISGSYGACLTVISCLTWSAVAPLLIYQYYSYRQQRNFEKLQEEEEALKKSQTGDYRIYELKKDYNFLSNEVADIFASDSNKRKIVMDLLKDANKNLEASRTKRGTTAIEDAAQKLIEVRAIIVEARRREKSVADLRGALTLTAHIVAFLCGAIALVWKFHPMDSGPLKPDSGTDAALCVILSSWLGGIGAIGRTVQASSGSLQEPLQPITWQLWRIVRGVMFGAFAVWCLYGGLWFGTSLGQQVNPKIGVVICIAFIFGYNENLWATLASFVSKKLTEQPPGSTDKPPSAGPPQEP